MKDKEFKRAISEVNCVMKHMSQSDIKKIPEKFRDFLQKNNEEEYNINIKANVPLNKQGLSDKAISLLGVIYRNYLCKNKVAYDKLITKNQEKYNEELRRKYEIKFK